LFSGFHRVQMGGVGWEPLWCGPLTVRVLVG
jgi:hypothetical protein